MHVTNNDENYNLSTRLFPFSRQEFRPERFIKDNAVGKDPFGFVPFSAGPRYFTIQHVLTNLQM